MGKLLTVLAATLIQGSVLIGRAWWMDAEFAPSGTTVLGEPMEHFSEDICAATSMADVEIPIGPEGSFAAETVRDDPGLGFSLSADMDRDGTQDQIEVGVFRSCDGSSHRYLATRFNPVDEAPIRHFLPFHGPPGFSVLAAWPDGGVSVFVCLYCDHGWTLDWDGENYILTPDWESGDLDIPLPINR